MINPSRLKKSFKYAFRGVWIVFNSEQSFRLQLFAAIVVGMLGMWFQIRRSEWIVLLLLIGSILSLELINSVFERMIDAFKPRIHPIVRDIKDIMAATVLIVSCIAVIIGLIIFVPYVRALVLP